MAATSSNSAGEILSSRLSLAIMDRASWEFADLRSRVSGLERREELDAQDMLRAHVVARVVVEAWRSAGLQLDTWRILQATLHGEFSHLVEEAYHETNRWLVAQGVMPEVDLRPLVRRTREGGDGASRFGGLPSGSGPATSARWNAPTRVHDAPATAVQDETRLMTGSPALGRSNEHAEQVLGFLKSLAPIGSSRLGAPQAPVLYLPTVFEPALCRRLINPRQRSME